MNVLVTGGAGFIGSHLVDALISASHNVIIIDNLSTGQLYNLNPQAIFIQHDINDPLDDIFEQYKIDIVFHLAAQINLRQSIKDPNQCIQDNITGSENIISYCTKYHVKKFVFSSTGGAIYDPNATLPWTENTATEPASPYGWSKLSIEQYLKIAHNLFGLNYSVLRYSNVYGPRQNAKGEAGVISIFIEHALQNRDLIIFGDGTQTRDFIYVDDIVQANMLAMEQDLNGVFNVSSNTRYSVNDIANQILRLTNAKSRIVHADPIIGEVLHTKLNSDKLKGYGWHQNWDIDRGMRATIDYFK